MTNLEQWHAALNEVKRILRESRRVGLTSPHPELEYAVRMYQAASADLDEERKHHRSMVL